MFLLRGLTRSMHRSKMRPDRKVYGGRLQTTHRSTDAVLAFIRTRPTHLRQCPYFWFRSALGTILVMGKRRTCSTFIMSENCIQISRSILFSDGGFPFFAFPVHNSPVTAWKMRAIFGGHLGTPSCLSSERFLKSRFDVGWARISARAFALEMSGLGPARNWRSLSRGYFSNRG